MNYLKWKTDKTISVGKFRVPYAENIFEKSNQVVGIRKDSKLKLHFKTILWPLVKLRDDLLVDGFIKREIGKWIKEFANEDTVFCEVGCGNMGLLRYMPHNIYYNAFDISFSEFHLRRILKKRNNINVALTSATEIPLEANSVSLVVTTECFEHIPEIDKAVSEIYRVAMPAAKLLCSIPNNYCCKYQKKGPHPDHVNNWGYDEFKKFMSSRGFKFIRGHMKGLWVPLPLWLTKISYQLSISSKNEYYNTNFFYIFEAGK